LKTLRAEEQAHIGMLMTELERWNRGKPGITFGIASEPWSAPITPNDVKGTNASAS
jgi:hypothetical protein